MCGSDNVVLSKWVTMAATVLVLVGGVNWLSVGAAKVDIVEFALGKGVLARAVYLLVGLAAVFLFFRRDTYLPFLGTTVFPSGALMQKVPQGASQEVVIRTIPGSQVVYWAAEPARGEEIGDYKEAYGKYENAGVAIADAQGDVHMKLRGPPRKYKVPWKGVLPAHVHFRIVKPDGWAGRVETYWLDKGTVEPFENAF
jgi:uncharacterized membrane protein YuzA (DUF378 family)